MKLWRLNAGSYAYYILVYFSLSVMCSGLDQAGLGRKEEKEQAIVIKLFGNLGT